MDPRDREKTAFSTPMGLFECQRMLFGFCNAPATFQQLMQHWLRGQIAESLLVYLNKILFTYLTSHLQNLDKVFQRLWRHGLKLQLNKCKLLQLEVNFGALPTWDFFFWTFSDFNCSAEATRTFSCLVFIYLNSYCPWPWYFLVVFYVQ